ncbi:MAG: DUF6531 domain-containing protein [Polyangiaceae bacterium]|nr:DUF6531 domain-containing protein [Polyangiaceae bacterium]
MFAGKQTDLVVGIDFHLEIVPFSPPMLFPMPFVGIVEPDPIGMMLQVGISWVSRNPSGGVVLVNGFPAVKTGDEAQNRFLLPHVVIPPGIRWSPLPKPLKLKPKPGPPPPPDNPAEPPGDAVMVTGSRTVYINGTNACRFGDLAMSCSDPVRLPSSMLLAVPKGRPVIIGGPSAFDWSATAKTLIFRNKWTAGLLHQFVDLLPPGRLRSLLSWGVCQLTGHPVDVATGRLLTRALDFELRGPIPIKFERYYSSAWAERDSPLGHGWSHTLDERIWLERGRVVYKAGDGREIEFHTYHLPGRKMREGQELFYPIDRLTLRCKGEGRWEICTPDGLVREFELLPGRGPVSRLKKIRNRLGQWIAFTYEFGELEEVRTSEDRYVRFEHRSGRLNRISRLTPESDGFDWYNQVEFEYSDEGDLVKATDSQKAKRFYQYEEHLLIKEIDRDGITFYFEYDGRDCFARCVRTWGNDKKGQDSLFFREIIYDLRNRRTFVEDTAGKTTIYEMNAGNAVTKITDPHGASTTYEYDDLSLRKTSETDALGHVTRFEYDDRGNETKRTLANGAVYTMKYNADNQIVGMADPVGLERSWRYDEQGRLTDTWDTTGGWVHLEYDGLYATKVQRPDGQWVKLERDAFGAVTKITQPDGAVEQRWYDQHGQLVKVRDGGGRVWRVMYDFEGRPIAYTYPDGSYRRLVYSGEGDILEQRTPTEDVEFTYRGYHQVASRKVHRSDQKVRFVYDGEDRLIGVTNEAGERYHYVLDACGRVKEEISFEGLKRSYLRDELGRVTMAFAPDGNATRFEYDVLGNVTRAKYSEEEEETFTYDEIGRLKTATNASGTVRFSRKLAQRVVVERFNRDWFGTRYDAMGRPQYVVSSRGHVQRAMRTPTGDLRTLTTWERNVGDHLHPSWRAKIDRDAAGLETKRSMPGGITSSWKRDVMGRPTLQTIAQKGDTTDWTEYEWTGIDRLTGQSDPSSSVKYTHDVQGRLAASVQYGTDDSRVERWRNPGPRGELYHTKERDGRIYGKGGVLMQSGPLSFTYDKNGNLEKKEASDGRTWTYAWSASGRLKSVATPDGKKVEFEYDALGRRIRKTSEAGTTRWLWNGNVPVHEWREGEDGAATTWVFEPDTFRPVAKLTSDGQRHSVITDYLGTPREMRDEAGELAWKAQLDIYGVATVGEGQKEDCPWRWQGQYEDVETGLYYNRFRYYDPSRGDYISQDPIGLLGYTPGSTLYAYTKDPNTWIDPFGLAFKTVDFAGSPDLFPAGPGQSNIVEIVMQGGRKGDFKAADLAGGFVNGIPKGYTWHHLADFNPEAGTCTMQLVRTEAHLATLPHEGACAQFGTHFGVKYDSPAAREAAEEQGWKKKRKGCQ